MKFCLVFIFIFVSLHGGLNAQTCAIAYEYQSPQILLKNKVKEVKVYEGPDSSQKILYHFFISAGGCADKLWHYDLYSKGTSPLQTTYTLSAQGKKRSFIKGRLSGGVLNEIENTSEEYTAGGKLLSRIKTETFDLVTITINKYDTGDYTKNDMRLIRKMPGGDTVSMVISSFDHTNKVYILKNKRANGWEETQKLLTSYRNNEIYEEKFFEKGKLVKTTTREELNARSNVTLNAGEGLANPLPPGVDPKPDSTYTDNEQFVYGSPSSPKKNLKFLVISYPMTNDHAKTDHYDVIDQKSGLIKKRLSFYSNLNLYFDYK